jgi:glycosyltransferase involved in cell wall biosynthesis
MAALGWRCKTMVASARAPAKEIVDILFVTPSLAENSLGRTYCLWMLARASGLSTQVVAAEGGEIWYPLKDTEFARDCRIFPVDAGRDGREPESPAPRLIIGVKPMPATIALVSKLSRRYGAPTFLDVDDPDLEMRLLAGWSGQRVAREVREFRSMLRFRLCRRYAYRHTRIVSNPELQMLYGGAVIPHVRAAIAAGRPHDGSHPRVAFVGTSRPHKGISVLREAVAELATQGFTLTITDTQPPDAHPWEEWVGETTLAQGVELVQNCDIVVTPSLPHARGQFPAKLVDAMLAARPVVVSNVPPLPWVVGSAGCCAAPDSVSSLVDALRPLASASLRTALGDRLRQRALEEFTVESQQERFRHVCMSALAQTERQQSHRRR